MGEIKLGRIGLAKKITPVCAGVIDFLSVQRILVCKTFNHCLNFL